MFLLATGQVNPNAPRTFGDGIIHSSQLDALVKGERPLPEMDKKKPTEQENRIGKLIADHLVDDGATVQFGQDIFHCFSTRM